MGYRSEVAYAIVFKSEADREAVLNKLTESARTIIREDADLSVPEQIRFYNDSIKWYVGIYAQIDAHEALIEVADLANEMEEIISTGSFVRLGEENNDVETHSWDSKDGSLPRWWQLVEITRSITVSWDVSF